MKTNDMGALILFTVLFSIALVSSIVISEDNVIEETIEDTLEDIIEDTFDLDDNALEGKIDISPFSPEKVEWVTEEEKKALRIL